MVKFFERRSLLVLLVPAIVYLLGQNAPAQVTSGAAITSGDLVVYQTYSGSTATTIGSVASQVYLDEYSPTGTLVQQIAANGTSPGQPGTAPANSQYALTGSGSATSEGEISLSPNGQYISLTGYNASIGLAGVSGTASSATSRTIGVFNTSGGMIDTSTSINNAFTANNIRSAATADGTNFYAVGSPKSTTSANGIWLATKGSTSGTQITPDNDYAISVYNNQLYVVDDTVGTNGVYSVANENGALPTSAEANTTELSIALANKQNMIATTTNPEAFALLNLTGGNPDTVYLADSVDGLIEKFSKTGAGTKGSDGNTASTAGFTLTGTIALANVAGLTATITSQGVQLYATVPYQSSSALGGIYSFLDTSPFGNAPSGTLNQIVSGLADESFKGVVVYPDVVPEPTSVSILTLGMMGLFASRHRRKTQLH